MAISKGGFTWGDILDLDVEDFNAAFNAAERLAKQMTGK